MSIKCPILTHIQSDRLDEWIRAMLWEGTILDVRTHRVEILRCKGIFSTEDGRQHLLQGVRDMYEITDLPARGQEQTEDGKLVFIGKGLTDDVRRSLLKLLYS